MNANEHLRFIEVLYADGGTGLKRWQSIDFIFAIVGTDIFIRQKYFAPEHYKDRREVSSRIEHIFEIFGLEYGEIPYCNSWEDFVVQVIAAVEPVKGVELWGKTLKRNDRLVIGDDIPFLSREPNLEYSVTEQMRVAATQEAASYSQTKEKKTKEKKEQKRDFSNLEDAPF